MKIVAVIRSEIVSIIVSRDLLFEKEPVILICQQNYIIMIRSSSWTHLCPYLSKYLALWGWTCLLRESTRLKNWWNCTVPACRV